jgi:heat shock protein HslJ
LAEAFGRSTGRGKNATIPPRFHSIPRGDKTGMVDMKLARTIALVGLTAFVALPASAQGKKPKAAPAEKQEAQPAGEKKYDKEFPTKATWTLKEINGKAPLADASLMIDGTMRGSGVSGCNTWSATIYPIKGQKLAMGPVVMTKKTCDTPLMTFEKEYLTILHSGPTWDQQGDTLTVKGPTGNLTFARSL